MNQLRTCHVLRETSLLTLAEKDGPNVRQKFRLRISTALAAVFAFITVLMAIQADAIPLALGQFVAEQGALTASAWTYSGTLPASFDQGFRARSKEDSCSDFFGTCDNQYTNGRRTMTSTAQNNPSYKLTFSGSFESPKAENWEGSLLDKSKGTTQTDISGVTFPEPGSGISNEHPIPEAWRSKNGYGVPVDSYAQFSRTYTPQSFLDVGQLGCPQFLPGSGGTKTGLCVFDSAWTKMGVNLEGGMTGDASITSGDSATQSVELNAVANRITTFKANDQPLFSGTVTGSNQVFNLVENMDSSVSANFDIKKGEATTTVNSTWNSKNDVASLDVAYVERVEMPDYIKVLASAKDYVVNVRDDPQLIAGISGNRFTTASVESYAGMGSIDTSVLPVYEAIAIDRVGILGGTGEACCGSLVRIPSGGFTQGISVPFDFQLSNFGGSDLSVNGVKITLVDDDFPLFNDTLATLTQNLNFGIPPNRSIFLEFLLQVHPAALNSADDFFEGSFLELAASAEFTFTDAFGTRTRAFDIRFVPEPSTWVLLGLAFASLGFSRRRKLH